MFRWKFASFFKNPGVSFSAAIDSHGALTHESHDYRGNVQCLDHHADRQEGGARVALLVGFAIPPATLG